ncbi:hypothetical protein EVAR_12116_1 [Eumeta japonica]|uniref:Uncharacterized protein n=1 Tax=Eumeta variegata TaxID=151549 RepID=A0A4C1U579_EUMVA|nr:hypothetical protein EVAR_12116_1 [Eumeta japonica]
MRVLEMSRQRHRAGGGTVKPIRVIPLFHLPPESIQRRAFAVWQCRQMCVLAKAASGMECYALPNRRLRIQTLDIHYCGGEEKGF